MCFRCSCILKHTNGYPDRHLLPDWDTQKWYVEQVNAGRLPVGLADLVDGAECGYQEWVMVRLPVDIAAKVATNAKRAGVSESEYMRKILVVQVGRRR